MESFFQSFGIFEWGIVLLTGGVLYVFLREMIMSGRMSHLLRLLFLLPVVIPLFFTFFSTDSLSNREEGKKSVSTTPDSAPKTSLFPVGGNAGRASDGLALKLSDDASKKTQTENSGRDGFSNVSAETKGNFTNVANPKPDPVSGGTATATLTNTPTSSSNVPASDGVNSSSRPIGDGEYSGQAKPLQTSLVPYQDNRTAFENDRGDIIPGEVKTSEYNDSGDGNGIKQASFQSGQGNLSSLRIPFDNLNYNEVLTLVEKVSDSIGNELKFTKQAVVHIEARVKKGSVGPKEVSETGSGVIVTTRKGEFFVLTNDHVAGKAVSNEAVSIQLDNKRVLHPTAIYTCPDFDIAVLRLAETEKDGLKAAALGNSDNVKLNDPVRVIGSPFGLEGTITSGIVSALDRSNIPLGNENQIQGFIQTDASTNPGNSGGPLINIKGEVIGIMVAIAGQNESSGVAFAIPINNVKHVAGQLIKYGSYHRPYFGVYLDKNFDSMKKFSAGLFNSDAIENAGKTFGTKISRVDQNSPADRVGLRSGDIITRFNGKKVEDETHFNTLICLSNPDDKPVLEILRDGNRMEVRPTLMSQKEAIAAKSMEAKNVH